MNFTVQFDLFPQKIYVIEKSCMPLTSITHGYVSHQIDGTTFPAFSLWKAVDWVAQLTHRLNLPRSPLIHFWLKNIIQYIHPVIAHFQK